MQDIIWEPRGKQEAFCSKLSSSLWSKFLCQTVQLFFRQSLHLIGKIFNRLKTNMHLFSMSATLNIKLIQEALPSASVQNWSNIVAHCNNPHVTWDHTQIHVEIVAFRYRWKGVFPLEQHALKQFQFEWHPRTMGTRYASAHLVRTCFSACEILAWLFLMRWPSSQITRSGPGLTRAPWMSKTKV